jgi:hypothetical protein
MFTVIWKPEAIAELTEVWLHADSPTRQRVTAAVNEIDALLRRSPQQAGESREANTLRVLIVATLVVEFYLSEDDRRIDIIKVWRFRERRQG